MHAARFKLFSGPPLLVEAALNEWAAALPPGTRIRRTQLAAAQLLPPPPLAGGTLGGALPFTMTTSYLSVVALVNFEEPAPTTENT